jgi:hypothetical protein
MESYVHVHITWVRFSQASSHKPGKPNQPMVQDGPELYPNQVMGCVLSPTLMAVRFQDYFHPSALRSQSL